MKGIICEDCEYAEYINGFLFCKFMNKYLEYEMICELKWGGNIE